MKRHTSFLYGIFRDLAYFIPLRRFWSSSFKLASCLCEGSLAGMSGLLADGSWIPQRAAWVDGPNRVSLWFNTRLCFVAQMERCLAVPSWCLTLSCWSLSLAFRRGTCSYGMAKCLPTSLKRSTRMAMGKSSWRR